jgi:trimethylamine---corrinoid protein Co-methyltransferase
VLFGQGMIETGIVYDLPSLVMDDEILDAVFRIIAGFDVNAIDLDVDLIKRIGPCGNYLAEPETVKMIRNVSDYSILNRKNHSDWEESGATTLIQRAKEKAFDILKNHKQRNALSNTKIKAIRQIIIDAEEELGVADFWNGKEDQRFIDNPY